MRGEGNVAPSIFQLTFLLVEDELRLSAQNRLCSKNRNAFLCGMKLL